MVTFLGLWPLVHSIPPRVLAHLPGLAGEALSLALIVALMSYVIMPLAHRYLFASSDGARELMARDVGRE